ncbi:MAG: PTS transporter subunit EIIA [bacterium]|nr:PTS transporter subunit EIIA [bacterium]
MKLSSLLNSDFIIYDIEGDNRYDIYKQLIDKLSKKIKLSDSTGNITNKLIERENVTQIPYEKGFSFPHLRLKEIDDLHVAVGILKKPVKLKSTDIDKTRLVLIFLISENTSQIYLKVLSTFTKYLLCKGNIDKLLNSRHSSQFLNVLDNDKVELRHTLVVEDIMNTDFPFVEESDSISKVFDLFKTEKKLVVPVLNKMKELVGVIDAYNIVSSYFPKHMLLLDNYRIFKSFEPFDTLFKTEDTSSVKEYMIAPKVTVPVDTPIIQITLCLLQQNSANIFVVDGKKLVGLVSMQEIIKKVIRG